MKDFIVPINLSVKIKNIKKEELENYLTDILLAIDSIFYSSDADDDHFEIVYCFPECSKIMEQEYYEY